MMTNGRAMRMLAMANEDTLAETRKARLTAPRLTRDMVRAKHRKATKAGFSPERVAGTCQLEYHTTEPRVVPAKGCPWWKCCDSEVKWNVAHKQLTAAWTGVLIAPLASYIPQYLNYF